MLVDTHCHLYNDYYENIDEIVEKINNSEVKSVINNACNLSTCKEVIELSNKYKNIYCALGLHPLEDLEELDDVLDFIKNNINNKSVVAIGEIGLDYYYSKENKDKQILIFRKQLELASELNIPVIVHSRDATSDTLSVLKDYKVTGVIHCFSGSAEVAKEYIKMGYKLGVNGVITFDNCKLIDIFNIISYKDVVFETDSPYLTPVPNRGKRNDPTYVGDVVKFIANKLSLDEEELIQSSYKNVKNIFKI